MSERVSDIVNAFFHGQPAPPRPPAAAPKPVELDVTLRDLFAAAALVGMYAANFVDGGEKMSTLAERAFSCADAMLVARTPRP